MKTETEAENDLKKTEPLYTDTCTLLNGKIIH